MSRRALAVGVAGLVGSGPALAGDWTITPTALVTETYSDNVGLDADGAKLDDLVTTARAGISLHGEGGRLSLDADYSVQTELHARASEGSSTSQQWQVGGEAEVFERIGFLEFRTTMSQINRTNIGRISDTRTNTDDRNDVFTFAITPIVRHRLAGYLDSESRVGYDRVTNDNSGDKETSESTAAGTVITSGRRFAQTPWSVAAEKRVVTNTDNSKSDFAVIDAEISYIISRRWSLYLGAGREKNDFVSDGDDEDGYRWQGGATWTPNRRFQISAGYSGREFEDKDSSNWEWDAVWTPSSRTQVSAGYVPRFFGDAYSFDLSHRSRQTQWTATYNESVTTSRQLQLERVFVALEDPFGNPIPDPVTGDPIPVPIDFVVPTDEVLVDRAFSGTMAYSGRRTTATITLRRSERIFQDSGGKETQTGATVGVSRTMSPRLSSNASVSWLLTEPRSGTGSGDETRWVFDASMDWVMSTNASGRVSYRYTTVDDDGGVNDFDENSLTASLNLRF